MPTLTTDLRTQLERTVVVPARNLAERAAKSALESLAVQNHEPYGHMIREQKDLRNKLRARARQLGDKQDGRGNLSIWHLAQECGYEHWHRMLFARFLAENNLLIHPEMEVSISLDECKKLAEEENIDLWALAGRYAQKMLPEIFRADDPILQVPLAREDQLKLETLLNSLPKTVFTADDSLGWYYQFWQTQRKKDVNKSGKSISADELAAVTQLFTEDYMVDFLLDNTIGAWWAGKLIQNSENGGEKSQWDACKTEKDCRRQVALPGCPWKYLRFLKNKDGKWRPAAGTFSGWPATAKELKCIDPCLGSGHFIVALLARLVALRVAEERTIEASTVEAVIRDNIFGLEIDLRCTQIAVFNLALAAWRRGGYRPLPAFNIACCGLGVNTKESDWLDLARTDEKVRRGMERLFSLFQKAPLLGSLINPRLMGGDLLIAEFHELQPLLEKVLAGERDEDAHEIAVAARGMAKAAEILATPFTLVATNVPYLGRGDQDEMLKDYLEAAYPDSKTDLATAFLERCLEQASERGSVTLVVPRIWLTFTAYYEALRKKILTQFRWNALVPLGKRAFRTIGGEVVDVVLLTITKESSLLSTFAFSDVSRMRGPDAKQAYLDECEISLLSQKDCLSNPGHVPLVDGNGGGNGNNEQLLQNFVSISEGISRGDTSRFDRCFWEMPKLEPRRWQPLIVSSTKQAVYGGASHVFLWEDGKGALSDSPSARVQGMEAWGKPGIFISRTHMNAFLTNGAAHAQNGVVVVPRNKDDLAPLWQFCSSENYKKSVLRLNQKLIKPTGVMDQVEFEAAAWRRSASKTYPNGLPRPFSTDPTQWLFTGHPKDSDNPLQVAVARLLGYRWPRQTGSSFPGCNMLGPDGIERWADKKGIVCIPSVAGNEQAAERLRKLLAMAYGKDWKADTALTLVRATGSKASDLDEWLRNDFFRQHCEAFEQTPFIWHIWDGRRRDGFHALVNYHTLVGSADSGRRLLETLTHSYLNDWIRRQKDSLKRGEEGADERLAASTQLKLRLEAILAGEPPYDIFARWKPLQRQPIGWEPDVEDGIRVNIRPFMVSNPKNGAEFMLLRSRPNIKWGRDAGTETDRSRREFPWCWKWNGSVDFAGGTKFDGMRWNDCHYSNAFKRRARRER